MKKWLTGLMLALCTFSLLAMADAEARRLGGGRSLGRQSSNVTQKREAAQPAQSPQPAQNAAQPAGTQSAAPAAPAPRPAGSRWLGPIAGLAAGLGIAALLSHFGLIGPVGEVLSSLIMIGLLVVGVAFLWRMLRGGRRTGSPQVGAERRMEPAYAGPSSAPAEPAMPPSFGQAPGTAPAAAALPGGAAVSPEATWSIPADFDTQAFLDNAKKVYAQLQAAWDRGDLRTLEQFTSDEMMDQIRRDLRDRGAAANQTEIVILNAQLLGIETVDSEHMASVRFSGMMREEPGAEAASFSEVWHLTKPRSGPGGWVLAGIQQTQ